MSRKRSMCDGAECGDVVVLDTNNALHDISEPRQQQKRSCGTACHPAPGELKADEVATYLHGLSAHLNNSQLNHASLVLDTAGWKAFAELNILLRRYLSTGALPDKLLCNYSRFTLQPRAQLWHRYSSYIAATAKLTPQQMELLRFLLEWVLAPFPDCALTEVTLQLPPWMVSWASRWGMASSSSSRIKLIRLEAYSAVNPCSSAGSTTGCRQLQCVLYMPTSL